MSSLEDSFLIVQNEVLDVLLRLRNNYTQWQDLNENTADVSREEYSCLVLELKNGIKSIQWDLDELEESLDSSDRQGKLDMSEIDKRRQFITKTREEVKNMNDKLSKTKIKTRPEFSMPNFTTQNFVPLNPNSTKYTRLNNTSENTNNLTSAGTSGPGENVLFSQNFNSVDDDSKSPYANDYTIGFEDDNHIHVVNEHTNKLVTIREWIHNRPRQSMAAVAATAVCVVFFFIFLI